MRVCGYYETKTDSREKTFGETPRYCILQHLLQTFAILVFMVLCSFVVNTTCVDISFSFRKVSSRTYILLVVSSMLSAQAEHCLMPVDMFLLDHQSTKLSLVRTFTSYASFVLDFISFVFCFIRFIFDFIRFVFDFISCFVFIRF